MSKNKSFQIYFNFSSGGVIFLASHFTRFNSNPTGKVSGSSMDHFHQTRISAPGFPCSINQLQIDQCIAKNVHQNIKRIAQSTDQGLSSIGLNLYQTSFLSHFLSIWCTVVSMLHFFAPTVYRTNESACIKNALLGGVRRANTPNFCAYLHQSARRAFPNTISNSVCSEFLFGLVWGTRTVKYSIFSQKNAAYRTPEIQSVLFAN